MEIQSARLAPMGFDLDAVLEQRLRGRLQRAQHRRDLKRAVAMHDTPVRQPASQPASSTIASRIGLATRGIAKESRERLTCITSLAFFSASTMDECCRNFTTDDHH